MKSTAIVMISVCLSICLGSRVCGGEVAGEVGTRSAPPASTSALAPYDVDLDHLWNRLHRALFVRTDANGQPHVHSTDPLLYRGGTFLLEGDVHQRALALLDEFLALPDDQALRDPLKRLCLQRDLWAAFDYVAWYPDDWVHRSRHEPAATALRARLAKAIRKLSLTADEINALPDNYALAAKSKQFLAEADAAHPEHSFLPPDLFDPAGPWVRFHASSSSPMAVIHFNGAGGRALHVIFLRLPGGRAATEQYIERLGNDAVQQFPEGTMVAMVRRGLAVDQSAKVRVTPITEMVQIRVYRRIPIEQRANLQGDFGEQNVYEFMLDRGQLFDGSHGLRSVGRDEPAVGVLRGDGDPFDRKELRLSAVADTQMKSCIQCHQEPGVYSVKSLRQGLYEYNAGHFRTFAWDVEQSYTVGAKVQRFDWGLLQGLLEAR